MNQIINKLKIQVEEIIEKQESKRLKHIKFLPDYGIQFLEGDRKKYLPSDSGKKFHESYKDEKYLTGPFGSGKSTICCMEIIHQASQVPKCKNGQRYARFIILRNTYAEIYSGIFKTYLHWMKDLGSHHIQKQPFLSVKHTYNDGKGLINLEVYFIPCERNDDIDKFRSVEFTGIYFNELSQFTLKMLTELQGRAGRYPSIESYDPDSLAEIPENKNSPIEYDKNGLRKWYTPQIVLGDTNPPDLDHWLYKYFEENKNPDKFLYIKQPPGLIKDQHGNWINNPNADNYAYIGKQYYLNIASTGTEEYIKVYCLGEYGIVRDGKFVYEQYNDDIHSTNNIEIIKGQPVYFGWDLGLNPAFVCCQYIEGQLRILKEFTAEYCSVKEFATDYVLPWINLNVKSHVFYSLCDPSDSGSAADNITCMMVLKELGLTTKKASTNKIIERIDSVKNLLTKMVRGKPALILNRRECNVLRRGFLGDYHFKKVNVIGEDRYHEIPNKLHPVSDIHDALQYVCLSINNIAKPIQKIDHYKLMDNSRYL